MQNNFASALFRGNIKNSINWVIRVKWSKHIKKNVLERSENEKGNKKELSSL